MDSLSLYIFVARQVWSRLQQNSVSMVTEKKWEALFLLSFLFVFLTGLAPCGTLPENGPSELESASNGVLEQQHGTAIQTQNRANYNPQANLSVNFHTPKQSLPPGLMEKLEEIPHTIDQFNKKFGLKRDINVEFLSQDTKYGIYCDLDQGLICIPYDDLLMSYDNLCEIEDKVNEAQKRKLAETVGKSAQVSLMHELSHVLINDFDLAVPGIEEDACDDMAAYLLANCLDDGKSNEECSDLLEAWFEVFLASATFEETTPHLTTSVPGNMASLSRLIPSQHSTSMMRAYRAYISSLTVTLLHCHPDDIDQVLEDMSKSGCMLSPKDDCPNIRSGLRSFRAWDKISVSFRK